MSDLPTLIAGLLYPSEDDRPFEVVDWPAGPASARAAVDRHVPAGVTVEPLTPAAFFGPLRDTTDAARFAALDRRLAAELTDRAAFRVTDGSAEVRVYVIGRRADGTWGGVQTVSVET